jgi:hypothetical protein
MPKEIILAFRPDTTDIPTIFTGAVVPIYTTSDWNQIKSLLDNQLKRYWKIAAIDNDIQSDRIQLVNKANELGFNEIELDEQVHRESLTASEYAELVNISRIPISVTGNQDPLYVWLETCTVKPKRVYATVYGDEIFENFKLYGLRVLREKVDEVFGVVNIADPNVWSSQNENFVDVIRYIYMNADGLWVWGWHTEYGPFDERAISNWPKVKQTILELLYSEARESLIAASREIYYMLSNFCFGVLALLMFRQMMERGRG